MRVSKVNFATRCCNWIASLLCNSHNPRTSQTDNQRVRFITSDKLERYTKVVEWDNGYLVMAKYKKCQYLSSTLVTGIS